MSIPKYGLVSAGAPGGQVPPDVPLDGLTELRVHGVGGEPPEALLNDLAPQQVGGDYIAGFYRTADDRAPDSTVSRHVEGYSWGGLTSRSSWRVFWLLLLPFMLGNLAGWMCSLQTKEQGATGWRFRLHRASVNLACLALTINLVLVTAMIMADVAAYQVVRVGADKGRWWLAPLRWSVISGHPARQVLIGILVPVVVVLLLWLLTGTSQFRYERVRPPYKGDKPDPPTLTVAAALKGGLSDSRFWDGEHSVRQSSRRHIAAAIGFLGLVLAVTSRDSVIAKAGHATSTELWWASLGCSAAVLAFVVIRTCIDLDPPDARYESARRFDVWSSVGVLIVAFLALACAGLFACLQPAVAAVAGQLPGMAGISDWTLTAVAVILALVLVSSAFGGWARRTLRMGPLVTTIVSFSLLNVMLFGLMLSFAHLLGSLTFAVKPPPKQIYLPEVVGFGTPALVMGALAAALLFGLAELFLWWKAGWAKGQAKIEEQYAGNQVVTPPQLKKARLEVWKSCALCPPSPDGQTGDGETSGPTDEKEKCRPNAAGKKWAARIARAERIGSASRDAAWLFWGLAVFEVTALVVTVTVHPAIAPDQWYGKAAISLATFLPVLLIGLMRAAWGQQGRRRQIGKLWDVGTFWPRSYHPLAPPSYAERAVPELQRRLWWIHDNKGHVVIAAHSQGSVLAVAALAQPKCLPSAKETGLLSFGSPLGKLYSWGFPAYVNDTVLGELQLLEKEAAGWKNCYYPTDPLGGAAFQERRRTVDFCLLDPAGDHYLYGQPPPAPGGHSGYWTDPRVWNQIERFARRFQPPKPPPSPPSPPSETAPDLAPDAAPEPVGLIGAPTATKRNGSGV